MSQSAKRKPKPVGIAGVAIALVAVLVGLWMGGRKPTALPGETQLVQPGPEPEKSTGPKPELAALPHFEAIAQRIRGTDDLSVVHEGFRELRSVLQGLTPDAASRAIQDFWIQRAMPKPIFPFTSNRNFPKCSGTSRG